MSYDITSITVIDKILGTGAFGRVSEAYDKNGSKLAVKICETTNTGIPNITEPVIMSSIEHPYINRCLDIFPEKEKLYIIQERAISDLARQVRKDYNGTPYTGNKLKKTLYQLVSAVRCLHRENILHCDIKASNVLCFEEGILRLGDFTLAIKKIDEAETYNHIVATPTHRPLECYLGLDWNEKLDIWSLGCTFYEIIFGKYFIPYQGTSNNRNIKGIKQKINKEHKKKSSELIKQKNIAAHLAYTKSRDIEYYNSLGKVIPPDLDFKEADKFSESFLSSTLGNLLENMLHPNPKKRFDIEQVALHPYFIGLLPIKYYVYKPEEEPIDESEKKLIHAIINQNSLGSMMNNMVLDIYAKIKKYPDMEITDKILSALCIASKMISNCFPVFEELEFPNGKKYTLDEAIELERNICTYLMFRLL